MGGVPPAAGETTVGRHFRRPVIVGDSPHRRLDDAAPNHHVALAEMTIDGTTVEVATAIIVATHPRRAVSSA